MGVVCIKLDSGAWEAAKARIVLIQQAENEVVRQRAMLEILINEAAGVDVSSGNWNLDIDHGLLEGTDDNGTEQDDLSSRRDTKARPKSRGRDSVHPTDSGVRSVAHG